MREDDTIYVPVRHVLKGLGFRITTPGVRIKWQLRIPRGERSALFTSDPKELVAISPENRHLVVCEDSRTVIFGGKTYHLSQPTIRRGNWLLAPVELFCGPLDSAFDYNDETHTGRLSRRGHDVAVEVVPANQLRRKLQAYEGWRAIVGPRIEVPELRFHGPGLDLSRRIGRDRPEWDRYSVQQFDGREWIGHRGLFYGPKHGDTLYLSICKIEPFRRQVTWRK